MQRILLCFLFAALATSSHAQTKDRLDRRDKLFGYEAVGRLDSRRGNCTAALIARDIVVTAAHCVHGKGDDFTFRAAYSDGAALASRAAKDVVIAEGYLKAVASRDRAGEIANDVALIRLTGPIHDAGIDPYDISRSPSTGTPLTLASYGRGRMEALTLERGCNLNTRYRDGVIAIDCDATFGSSGAPVFTQVAGRPKIISIVSSGGTSAQGVSTTFGVELTTIVPQLMQQLRNNQGLAPASTGARRMKVGERPSGSARFVRPGGS